MPGELGLGMLEEFHVVAPVIDLAHAVRTYGLLN